MIPIKTYIRKLKRLYYISENATKNRFSGGYTPLMYTLVHSVMLCVWKGSNIFLLLFVLQTPPYKLFICNLRLQELQISFYLNQLVF